VLGLDEELYVLLDTLAKERKESYEKSKDGFLMIFIALCLPPFTLGISLFLLLGGVAEFSSSASKLAPISRRSEHPIEIQKLIDSLNQQIDAA
jgi:hypothetical protein